MVINGLNWINDLIYSKIKEFQFACSFLIHWTINSVGQERKYFLSMFQIKILQGFCLALISEVEPEKKELTWISSWNAMEVAGWLALHSLKSFITFNQTQDQKMQKKFPRSILKWQHFCHFYALFDLGSIKFLVYNELSNNSIISNFKIV